jgi:hypothetical protein
MAILLPRHKLIFQLSAIMLIALALKIYFQRSPLTTFTSPLAGHTTSAETCSSGPTPHNNSTSLETLTILDRNFSVQILTSSYVGSEILDIGDVDQDGRLDIVQTNWDRGEVGWWQNLGNENFLGIA